MTPEERDRLLSEAYDELRVAAARLLRREAPLLTLEATELVNEAALRIAKLDRMDWVDRQHFFATSARILRQTMLDAIRSRKRAKRQAPAYLPDPDDGHAAVDLELLDAALDRLESVSPDLARIVELRFFVGLNTAEIAELLICSEPTVKRRWRAARVWLASELSAP